LGATSTRPAARLSVIGWIGANAYGEPMNVFWSMTLSEDDVLALRGNGGCLGPELVERDPEEGGNLGR